MNQIDEAEVFNIFHDVILTSLSISNSNLGHIYGRFIKVLLWLLLLLVFYTEGSHKKLFFLVTRPLPLS